MTHEGSAGLLTQQYHLRETPTWNSREIAKIQRSGNRD